MIKIKTKKLIAVIIWIILTTILVTWFIHGFSFHDNTANVVTIITSFSYSVLSFASKFFTDFSFIKLWFDGDKKTKKFSDDYFDD